MPEPKTQCAACGAEILVSTSKKAGGRCLPCANGTRASIEAGRLRAKQDAAFRASAVWKFWERLVASNFTALHPAEQLYLAVNELRGSVLDGGFHSYFSTFGERADVAEEGLRTLNALHSLQLLREARQLVGNPASNRPQPAIDRQLDDLDRRFYADVDGLWEKLEEYGVQQCFFPKPQRSEGD